MTSRATSWQEIIKEEKEGPTRKGRLIEDIDSTMANPTLVISPFDDVNTKFITASPRGLWKSLEMKGVFINAAKLIFTSCRKSSAVDYESSWSKRATWCSHAKKYSFQITK